MKSIWISGCLARVDEETAHLRLPQQYLSGEEGVLPSYEQPGSGALSSAPEAVIGHPVARGRGSSAAWPGYDAGSTRALQLVRSSARISSASQD